MKTKIRTVSFYDLQLQTLSLDKKIENPFSTNIKDVLAILAKHLQKGHEIGANKNVEVTDFSFDRNNCRLTLLLNKPDPDLSDVTYKDRRTKARRSGNKSVTEAIEISSHIVISALSNQAKAEVRMTMGAGIYINRVTKLLNMLYDKYSGVDASLIALSTRPHPTNIRDENNQVVTYKVRHRFESLAHPNAWLTNILNNGTVQGIELIEQGSDQFDSDQPHEITRRTMSVKPSTGKVSTDIIRKIAGIANKKYHLHANKVRIEYKLAGGESSERLFLLNDLDAKFTKSESIDLDTDHNQQQSVISNEIIAKMLALP